jgi:hypothetical protein
MVAAVSALVIIAALTAFLPVTLSVFAYAFVESRHRHAWTRLAQPAVHLGGGPYRAADVVTSRLQRAPLLVRAAAIGCFYWGWFCILAWVTVGVVASERLWLEALAGVGVVVAVFVGRAGVRLLRRDARVVAFGRRVAVVSVAHAWALVLLGVFVGGYDWSAPATVFGVVSLGQATLLVLALREHGPLFAEAHDGDAAPRPLPTWLSRMLARQAQRRANFLASASHTSPGA